MPGTQTTEAAFVADVERTISFVARARLAKGDDRLPYSSGLWESAVKDPISFSLLDYRSLVVRIDRPIGTGWGWRKIVGRPANMFTYALFIGDVGLEFWAFSAILCTGACARCRPRSSSVLPR